MGSGCGKKWHNFFLGVERLGKQLWADAAVPGRLQLPPGALRPVWSSGAGRAAEAFPCPSPSSQLAVRILSLRSGG